MAEYENRETKYNDNIGQVVGRFCTAIVEADALSKDAYARRMLALVKAPSAEFQAESSIIGMDQSMVTTIKTPMMTIMDNRPIVIDEATLELDMTVAAHTESSDSLKSETGLEAEGKGGWGPFSVSVKIKSTVSVAKESKRSSDYRSHTNAKVTMRQGDVPEGLARIIDAMTESTSKALEINSRLIEQKSEAIAANATIPDALPAPEAEKEAA